jgi:hypothetical protein
MMITATMAALRGFAITLLAMLASSTPARTAGGASLPSSDAADAAMPADSDLNVLSADMIASSTSAAASSLVACPAHVWKTNGEARNRQANPFFRENACPKVVSAP